MKEDNLSTSYIAKTKPVIAHKSIQNNAYLDIRLKAILKKNFDRIHKSVSYMKH